MHRLICLVGMCGAGKSAVADYLTAQREYHFLRFGQIVLDHISAQGKEPSEALEREVRESLRATHGMAAFALLNLPKLEALLSERDVIGDGLYSWEEYLVLREKFADSLTVVAVYAPPALRYERIAERAKRHDDDPAKRYRSFTPTEAAARDRAEIERLNKGGPIAMADVTLTNTGTLADLYRQVDRVLAGLYP